MLWVERKIPIRVRYRGLLSGGSLGLVLLCLVMVVGNGIDILIAIS